MADLGHTWPGYIQQEEAAFKAANSEYTAGRVGEAVNYLKDVTDTNSTDISNINTTLTALVKFDLSSFSSPAGVGPTLVYTTPNTKNIFEFGIYIDSITTPSNRFYYCGTNGSDVHVNVPGASGNMQFRLFVSGGNSLYFERFSPLVSLFGSYSIKVLYEP